MCDILTSVVFSFADAAPSIPKMICRVFIAKRARGLRVSLRHKLSFPALAPEVFH